jgi:hypothetical protein
MELSEIGCVWRFSAESVSSPLVSAELHLIKYCSSGENNESLIDKKGVLA